jgi:hypothetical protein
MRWNFVRRWFGTGKNLRLPLDFAGLDRDASAAGHSAQQPAAVASAGRDYRRFLKVLS